MEGVHVLIYYATKTGIIPQTKDRGPLGAVLKAQSRWHDAERLGSQHAGKLSETEGSFRGTWLVECHHDVFTLYVPELKGENIIEGIEEIPDRQDGPLEHALPFRPANRNKKTPLLHGLGAKGGIDWAHAEALAWAPLVVLTLVRAWNSLTPAQKAKWDAAARQENMRGAYTPFTN